MDTSPLCPSCGKPLAPDAPQGLCQECLLKAGFPTGTDTGGKSPRFVPPSIEEMTAKFPQLEILAFIGQGGMGAVYKARQKQLNRLVALKILPPDISGEPAFAERFAREARALARLNHPGIVTLYEFGQADGLFFFLMEFVDGVNLRQLLRNGRVSPREALAIVPQICDALQFAHDQGVVHRDIKPENILLDRHGRVKVADFGVAKLVGSENEPASGGDGSASSSTLTESGKVMGTPSYMAPEQVSRPAEVDHRADIYALGVVFYQMLTGELPGEKIEPPSSKVRVDVRLDEVVLCALENEPERRYQHVSELGTAVETISVSPASPPPIRGKTANNIKSKLVWCAAGVAAIVVALAGVYFAMHPHDNQPGVGGTNSLASADKEAVDAAQKWLKAIDTGQYAQSWQDASVAFQTAVSEESWESALDAARKPLGELESRKLESAQYATQLPDAPDGEYVIMQFAASFANRKSAVETVTFVLEKDGLWKSSGYFIK